MDFRKYRELTKIVLALGTVALALGIPRPVYAIDEDRMQQLAEQLTTMQKTMFAMQQELHTLQAEQQQEKEEQSRKQDVLAEEVDKLRTSLTIPEFKSLSMEDSVYGLGPAASKVYGVAGGLSIGGYGEAFYRKDVGDKTKSDRDTADFLRFVLYAGYKFTDRIILNTELEFEHATTSSTESASGGSVSVEFAYLDFLMWKWMNFRAGMLLVPMGIVNELHEPVFFNGVERPEVERRIIPSTWRENGIGIFGALAEGLEYRLYGINGLNAKGFRDNGFRGGRQKGNRTLAEDVAFVARLDYSPTPNFMLGASVYTGDSGQNQEIDAVELPDSRTTIWELHSIYRYAGLEARGLFAMSHLGDTGELTDVLRAVGELDTGRTLASQMIGGYGEVSYDIIPFLYPGSDHTLTPFFRFSYLNLQHKTPSGSRYKANLGREMRIWTPGVSYKPHANVVLKVDYRNFDTVKGHRSNEVNFGIGFVF